MPLKAEESFNMPKQTVSDVFGEMLESGQAPAMQTKNPVAIAAKSDDQQQKDQIERMSQIDKKQSREAYENIQAQIRMIQKQKESMPRKYVTAATGFDEEQVKSPETFWEKMKKKKEEKDKSLPLSSQQGMGTGEIRRGVSG